MKEKKIMDYRLYNYNNFFFILYNLLINKLE